MVHFSVPKKEGDFFDFSVETGRVMFGRFLDILVKIDTSIILDGRRVEVLDHSASDQL